MNEIKEYLSPELKLIASGADVITVSVGDTPLVDIEFAEW